VLVSAGLAVGFLWMSWITVSSSESSVSVNGFDSSQLLLGCYVCPAQSSPWATVLAVVGGLTILGSVIYLFAKARAVAILLLTGPVLMIVLCIANLIAHYVDLYSLGPVPPDWNVTPGVGFYLSLLASMIALGGAIVGMVTRRR
jgi:hypothetical protein